MSSRGALVVVGAVTLGLATSGVATAQTADPGRVSETQLRASIRVLDAASSVRVLTPEVESLVDETTTAGLTTVTLSADVLFAFAKADLTPDATAKIAEIAQRLAGVSGTVQVVGHTDSIGADPDNLVLSQARAGNVRSALLAALPRPLTIDATGRGESEPVAPNTSGGKDDPVARAKNRRVTISFR